MLCAFSSPGPCLSKSIDPYSFRMSKRQQNVQISLPATEQGGKPQNLSGCGAQDLEKADLRIVPRPIFCLRNNLSKNTPLHLAHLRRCFLPLLSLCPAAHVLSTMLVYKKLWPIPRAANILWKTRLKLLKHLFLWKVFNTRPRNLSLPAESKRQQQDFGS